MSVRRSRQRPRRSRWPIIPHFSRVAKNGPLARMLFRKLRKLPAERVAISQVAKASRGARGRFAGCESFSWSAWRFPAAGKFPAKRVAFSRSWKVSRVARGVFQRLESFPRSAWRFPAAGKFPAKRVAFSSGWKILLGSDYVYIPHSSFSSSLIGLTFFFLKLNSSRRCIIFRRRTIPAPVSVISPSRRLS